MKSKVDARPGGRLDALLGLARRGRLLTIGTRATQRELQRGRVKLLLLAIDGSERNRRYMEYLAIQRKVPWFIAGTKASLGHAVGGRAVTVVGILDAGLAKGIRAVLEGEK